MDVSMMWPLFPVWEGGLPSDDGDWQEGLSSICSNIPDVTKHLLFSHRGQPWNRLRFGLSSVESSPQQPSIVPLLSFQVAAVVRT